MCSMGEFSIKPIFTSFSFWYSMFLYYLNIALACANITGNSKPLTQRALLAAYMRIYGSKQHIIFSPTYCQWYWLKTFLIKIWQEYCAYTLYWFSFYTGFCLYWFSLGFILSAAQVLVVVTRAYTLAQLIN